MTFGEVVQLYLKELGITQTELAKRAGYNKQTINALIKERDRSPTLNTAADIANALGVSLQEMVDRMEGEVPQRD